MKNKQEYLDMWNIYIESFPDNERRTMENHKELLNNELYNIKSIKEDDKIIGFIAWWNIHEFRFIEHFAIDIRYRNGGYGSRVLNEFIEENDTNIILEVEPKGEELSNRRIGFYERLGFIYNDYEYKQPQLSKDKEQVNLRLMSFGQELSLNEFHRVKNTLYKYVYNEPIDTARLE